MEDAKWPKLPAHLEEVSKAFGEKYYDGAAKHLDEHLKTAKKSGEADQVVLVYALLGFSHLMRDDADAADRAYRKALGNFGPFSKAIKKLRKSPDGAARADRGLYAIGATLFYFGEKKRHKVAEIGFPYYSGGDDPQEMRVFIDGKAKPWIGKISTAIQKANKAYKQVIDLRPESSPYWTVAAHSRMGAMAATIVNDVRTIPLPDSWSQEGDSPYKAGDGKPLPWKQIRTAHDKRVEALVKNALANANKSYGECKRVASESHVDSIFAQSCSAWLSANSE